MFLEFVSLGFTVVIGLVSASPYPQKLENQTKGQEITFKQTLQNLQNVQQKQSQAQRGFQQPLQRNSFPNQGYYRPSLNDGFGTEYSDYEDPNLSFQPAYNGFRPKGDRGFDSYNFQGLGNGNQPGFGGWNRPLRPRPVLGAGDRGFGVGGQGTDSSNDPLSDNGNQVGSDGIDNQQGLGGSSSGAGNQGSDNGGGSGSGNEVQPQNGGQSWTTVRTPVNRIFGEFTVPEIAECIRRCPSVSQYDPICGSDNITYTNRAKFQCARQCGRVVTEAYRGSCASATTS